MIFNIKFGSVKFFSIRSDKGNLFYIHFKVDHHDICYSRGEDVTSGAALPLSNDILQAMKINANKTLGHLWQYYGTEEGTNVLYPAAKRKNCTNYDPRYR